MKKNNSKKILLINLPAVDTAQDCYIKGFIFPSYIERYLLACLTYYDIPTRYIDLNKGNFKSQIEEIKKYNLVYIHLIPQKFYPFLLISKFLIKNNINILVGGPGRILVKRNQKLFINNAPLEEEGIYKFLGHDFKSPWGNKDYKPFLGSKLLMKNKSITQDFSSVILTKRGCEFHCNFCIFKIANEKCTYRSINSIKWELDSLLKNKEKLDIFLADSGVVDNSHYKKLFHLFEKYRNLKYSFNIRADQILKENLKLGKLKNLKKVYVGVESLSNKVLSRFNKGENVDIIKKAIKKLEKNNISYHLSFIITSCAESNANLELTKIMNFLKGKKYDTVSIHSLIPYPGTTYFKSNIFKSRGWPFKLKPYSRVKEREVLKNLGYPYNRYHTITRHNHENTFKRINQKLNEIESIIKRLSHN